MSARASIYRTARPSILAMSSLSTWYIPEMSAVCHNVAEITRGRAAHTGFALPVAPQMLRCRGGSLSRAHSVGRPLCRHGSVWPFGSCSFGWTSYFFRLPWVAPHCSCQFATRSSAGLQSRGWEIETKLLRVCRRPFTSPDVSIPIRPIFVLSQEC